MHQSDSLDTQAHRLWANMDAWISDHSLQIILGFATGNVWADEGDGRHLVRGAG